MLHVVCDQVMLDQRRLLNLENRKIPKSAHPNDDVYFRKSAHPNGDVYFRKAVELAAKGFPNATLCKDDPVSDSLIF